MNIYKPYQWDEMTDLEKLDYLRKLEDRLLEHRYRYYVQDDPVLDDAHYDHLEKTYEYVCSLALATSITKYFVDWNPKCPGAAEAEQRVLNETDHHSLWIKDMQPIWDLLGKPSKIQKREDKEE